MKRIGYLLIKYAGSVLLLLFFLSTFQTAHAQDYEKTRKELQEKQKKTRTEIDQLNQQITSYQNKISETEKKFSDLKKEYDNLKKEIALRNAVIKKQEKERKEVEDEIKVTEESYRAKEKDLKKLITNYKHTLRYLYMHGRTSELALILTSHSFNQMLIRSYYLRKFELYRQHQADGIKKAQADLKQKESNLKQSKAKKSKIIAETQSEREALRDKIKKRSDLINQLRHHRKSLKAILHKTRDQVNNLNNTLSELIKREESVRRSQEKHMSKMEAKRRRLLAAAKKIKDAAKRREEVARYSRPLNTTTVTDAQLDKFDKEFSSERGKLPWPVKNGVITAHFGTKINPIYDTRITNLGIEITTKPQSQVHAVSDGYVFAVKPLTGFDNLVFVNHGKYKTVYGNLSKVYVHKNMIVHKGDLIGLSGDKYSAKGDVVFFMIRDGNRNVNPQHWITKHP